MVKKKKPISKQLFFLSFPIPVTTNEVSPSIAPFDFGEQPANMGESAGVQCMITKGDTPIKIKWILNSALLTNGDNGVSIVKLSSKTSALNIESVNENHRGVYKCAAENHAGEVHHSSELHVNGI